MTEHVERAPAPSRTEIRDAALMWLAAMGDGFPHTNVAADGKTVGVPDSDKGAWCLGCTVQTVLGSLGYEPPRDDEDGHVPDGVADDLYRRWQALEDAADAADVSDALSGVDDDNYWGGDDPRRIDALHKLPADAIRYLHEMAVDPDAKPHGHRVVGANLLLEWLADNDWEIVTPGERSFLPDAHAGDGLTASLQWKGTDACLDFDCPCGAHGHFDGMFADHVRCPACGQAYRLDNTVTATPVDTDRAETLHVAGVNDEELL